MIPKSTSEEFAQATQKLAELEMQYSSIDNSAQSGCSHITAWLDALIIAGWDRGALYHLIQDAMAHSPEGTADWLIDCIFDYESFLTGQCSMEWIKRFQGEPEDRVEFLNYVHLRTWMEDY